MRNLMDLLLHWSPTEGVTFTRGMAALTRKNVITWQGGVCALQGTLTVISDFLRAFPLDLGLHLEQARFQLAQKET